MRISSLRVDRRSITSFAFLILGTSAISSRTHPNQYDNEASI